MSAVLIPLFSFVYFSHLQGLPVLHLLEKKSKFVFNTSVLLGLARLFSEQEVTKTFLATMMLVFFFCLLWVLSPWDFRNLLIYVTIPPHLCLLDWALTHFRGSPILWEVPKLYNFVFLWNTDIAWKLFMCWMGFWLMDLIFLFLCHFWNINAPA